MRAHYEIIIIGGGHAGAEAAWAAGRLGAGTLLITLERAALGRMSCNPAIGGIGKGQMVREIDALGGLMGLAADAGGIQFRLLNRRKGPAVHAPRAQCDRGLYAAAVRELLEDTPNLTIIEGRVEDIEAVRADGPGWVDGPAGGNWEGCSPPTEVGGKQKKARLKLQVVGSAHPTEAGRRIRGFCHGPGADARAGGGGRLAVRGVRLADGRTFRCRCVIVTTGTFLRGLMHTGEHQAAGGRIGEASAVGLSAALERLGLSLGRLKTGTPPRVAREGIDTDRLEVQPGDETPAPFSFMTDTIERPQIDCWITYTNEGVHDLIRSNLHRAPMYSGQITTRGPRYCPSIEDKVVRFADKPRHQIFLEPEGYDSDRVYCNGISTSLPVDVQESMVRRIDGLEDARIVQHGYAVEYDYVPPHQTRATLETKGMAGLFLAGQINGTSGYEEAAGQGLVAGVNAAARVLDREPLVMGRDQSYIAVMIDDLVTKGTIEPYRMFTSRAEYRLLLRSDNADARLTPLGRSIGLVGDARWRRFRTQRAAMRAFEDWARRTRHNGRSCFDWLKRANTEEAAAIDWGRWKAERAEASGIGDALLNAAIAAVRIEAKYDGYVRRQDREIERFRRMESRRIPEDFDYAALPQLRHEAREKLAAIAPRSLGQARRISGISPADIAVLMIYLGRNGRGRT